jgi:molybdopterin/thiamine biosynthesis adenylyltransferase
MERYLPQIRFAPLGEEGQRRLTSGRVLICGCGALGSTAANLLVRAGVGTVRIVDRDFVELTNLHRAALFDEADAAAALPKAVAAAGKLRAVNSSVAVEPVVADVTPRNVVQLCEGMDLLIDGTDNFETRFLLNDAAVKLGLPWIYAGCVGAEGQTMTILPRKTPCLRCLMETCPPPGAAPTCDTSGILGPIVGVLAALETAEAMKILSGNRAAVSPYLTVIDLWQNRLRQIEVQSLRGSVDCPACRRGEYRWLAGREGSRTAVLCGRNAVQIDPAYENPLSLDELAARLAPLGPLTQNPYLLRVRVAPHEIILFADGRAIVAGTDDPAAARAVYAKYIGM